jgi:exodeoxyribonuclease VII large subunit
MGLMDSLEFTGQKGREVFSVTEIVAGIRSALKKKFRDVWVEGEITNLLVASSGHCYFTLRDQDAQIRAVCFRMQYRSLEFEPRNGIKVRARAHVSVYPERGDLQLIVDTVEPAGTGSLQEAFQRLKQKLQAEGLFDQELKKKTPLLPSRIGVVTSLKGAALQDILRVLKRRNDQLDILIAPVLVQGRGAAEEIALALNRLNQCSEIDCIIVGRGGGSLEDLWAFNEEIVGRAIFNSTIPVISAVGHETDFTISDFIADVRAATPSAAAELVSAARQDLLQRNDGLSVRLRQAMLLCFQEKKGALQRIISSHAFVSASERLRRWQGTLNEAHFKLLSMARVAIRGRTGNLESLDRELLIRMKFLGSAGRLRLQALAGQLSACSPFGILNRGYAIVSSLKGEVIRDPKDTSPGEIMDVRVAKGVFQARKES